MSKWRKWRNTTKHGCPTSFFAMQPQTQMRTMCRQSNTGWSAKENQSSEFWLLLIEREMHLFNCHLLHCSTVHHDTPIYFLHITTHIVWRNKPHNTTLKTFTWRKRNHTYVLSYSTSTPTSTNRRKWMRKNRSFLTEIGMHIEIECTLHRNKQMIDFTSTELKDPLQAASYRGPPQHPIQRRTVLLNKVLPWNTAGPRSFILDL